MGHSVNGDVAVVVVMGVSGSGKTTVGALLAGELGWDFAEADEFHPQANIDKMAAGTPLTDEDRWPWLRSIRQWIDERIDQGGHGVVTCSALKRSYRDVLRRKGVVFVHLAGSRETIFTRMAVRSGHFMPASLLHSQFEILEEVGADEDGVRIGLDEGRTPSEEARGVLDLLELVGGAPADPGGIHLGIVGLGRMGGGMRDRLRAAGRSVFGFDRSPDSSRDVATIADLVAVLPRPRAIWLMVPAGEPTDQVVGELGALLAEGDIVVDGGNTHYPEDLAHSAALARQGVRFVDVGTSGGVWGQSNGYALMVGGAAADVAALQPVFDALTPGEGSGFVHAGPVGAGHFAKMVHNGIEYGMMQALGEGYSLLHDSALIDDVDAVIASWRDGSVVRSWLLDLLVAAGSADPGLAHVAPLAAESGEAKWMVQAGLESGVPLPVTAASVFARQVSQGHGADAMRVVAALRNQFGGHAIQPDPHS